MKLFRDVPSKPTVFFWVFYACCVLLMLLRTDDVNALEQDKAMHMVAGGTVAVVTVSLLDDSFTSEEKFVTAVTAASVVGLVKELNDRGKKGHTYDLKDALATSVGSVVCAKISINF